MNRVAHFLVPVALAVALSGCADALMEEAHAPGSLTGRVTLEDQADHYGIEVSLSLADWSVTLLTDADGTFTIPSELAAGEWSVRAAFPFFGRADSGFTVENGVPTADVAEMRLPRRVAFTVTTDAPAYRLGDPVAITLVAENAGDEEVVLRSATSPMLAVAIASGGSTRLGSLMPGDEKASDEVALAPGESRSFHVTWRTQATPLAPGVYQVYAILAASETYPDFFSPDFPELNAALYAKLTPANVKLVAFDPLPGDR